jgi:hypothetical protein
MYGYNFYLYEVVNNSLNINNFIWLGN